MSNEEAPVFERSVQSEYLDDKGREKPNPVPLEPPVGYKKQPSMVDVIRAQVAAVSREAAMRGAETEEEANDFDVGDDYEPTSPWEHDFEPDPAMERMIALQSKPPAKPQAAQPAAAPPPAPPAESVTPKP